MTKRVKSFEQGESQREYLVHSELQALATAKCKYEVLKNAFIFSCLSGLRWSDIDKLKWSEVRDEDTGCRIIFRQKNNAILMDGNLLIIDHELSFLTCIPNYT